MKKYIYIQFSTLPHFTVQIDSDSIVMMADSGSSINIIDEKDYQRDGGSLFRWKTSQQLNLIQPTCSVHIVENFTDKLINEFSDILCGVGKLKDYQVHLHIDETVIPVAQGTRRVPFHVRKDLEEQLARDEELGIIE
ncbi:uncharacterized protein LOC117112337 [Anneissia japonica]|uniref:uncharacterized protein LOC117112337 n=1 Tax=Anneissia japonica TaxID=1529436 RepID=UPI0014257824|nr:uncharacterized protein LOC117112337 [Anneissia japonica]